MKNQRESWRDNSISEKFFKLLFDFDDFIFEKFYGYELSGVIGPENLVEGNVSSSTHATGYHAVWNRNLRKLIREALKTELQFTNFIDIGSGKGKACLYSAHTRVFRK